MKKRIYIFALLILLGMAIYGQDFITIEKEPRSVPVKKFNKKYHSFLNKRYNEFIKNKYDSVLLLQVINLNIYNYSILIAKKDGLEEAFAYKQSDAPDGEIKTFKLNNDTLKKVSIGNLFYVLQNDYVRTQDSTHSTLHDDFLYCRFFFRKTKKLYMGYYERIMDLADPQLDRQYVLESNRLLK